MKDLNKGVLFGFLFILAITLSLGFNSGWRDAAVSDIAYDATTWNGVTTVAPSKNAVRDKIELLASTFNYTQTIFVGKHGVDTQDGLSPDQAVLTFGEGITKATALTPAADNRIAIVCMDGGIYAEDNLTVPSYVHVVAPAATLDSAAANNTIILEDETSIEFFEVIQDAAGPAAIVGGNQTGKRYVEVHRVTCTGASVGVVNFAVTTAGIMILDIDEISVATGKGIGDNSADGVTHMYIGKIGVSGNSGIGIFKGGAGELTGHVDRIVEIGTPTTTVGLDLDAGTTSITFDSITMDTAYNVAVGAVLDAAGSRITGTRTNAGTAHVVVATGDSVIGGNFAATTYTAGGAVTDAEFAYLGDVTGLIQAQIDGKQPLDTDLTNIAGADTWMMYYKNGSAVLTDLALGAQYKFLMSNGAAAAPTWESIAETHIDNFTDVTTANRTTAKHGLAQKLNNTAYSYEDGTGTWRNAVTIPADPDKDQGIHWDDSAGAFAYHEEGRYVAWTIVDSDTDTAVADGKQAFVVPADMNGMLLVDVTASVADLNSASGGFTTVVLRRVRAGTPQDMTSTGVTIAHDAYTESDETVDESYDDLATGDNIYVDVDAVTTGAVQKGLSVTATFRLP